MKNYIICLANNLNRFIKITAKLFFLGVFLSSFSFKIAKAQDKKIFSVENYKVSYEGEPSVLVPVVYGGGRVDLYVYIEGKKVFIEKLNFGQQGAFESGKEVTIKYIEDFLDASQTNTVLQNISNAKPKDIYGRLIIGTGTVRAGADYAIYYLIKTGSEYKLEIQSWSTFHEEIQDKTEMFFNRDTFSFSSDNNTNTSTEELVAIYPKVYFYASSYKDYRMDSYIVKGQKVKSTKTVGDFYQVSFTYNGITTNGYMLNSDLEKVK